MKDLPIALLSSLMQQLMCDTKNADFPSLMVPLVLRTLGMRQDRTQREPATLSQQTRTT